MPHLASNSSPQGVKPNWALQRIKLQTRKRARPLREASCSKVSTNLNKEMNKTARESLGNP
eukprot:4414697-Amphidinium_carterae.1